MKKMKFYLIVLSLMACKKESINDCAEPTFDVNIARTLIIGKWAWKITYYYDWRKDSSATLTPGNQKLERMMEFKSDGNLFVFENGNSILETPYQFIKDTFKLSFDSTRYIISWKGNNSVFKICSEYLYLPSLTIYSNGRNEVWARL
jgi:hypothetical protein